VRSRVCCNPREYDDAPEGAEKKTDALKPQPWPFKCASIADTKMHITEAAVAISQVMICAKEERDSEV
jgi:hypothetical protein